MADKKQVTKPRAKSKGTASRSTAASKSAASGSKKGAAAKSSRSTSGRSTAKTNSKTSKSAVKKKVAKKSVTESLKSAGKRTKSAPKVEPNRPQGSQEGKRKRQQAKRKRQFDSVMADFKERTNIESLEPLVRVPTTILGSGWHASKITSLLLLFLAASTILLIFTEPRFFVYADDVTFQNLNYLYPEELYPDLEIDGWSIFWIRPDKVREAVIEHSYVADAAVSVRFPSQVTISVKEEEPAALWVTDVGQHWVLEDGTTLPVRTDTKSNLVQILDGQQDAALADAGESFLQNTSVRAALSVEPSSNEPVVIGAENLAATAASKTESQRTIDGEILQSALQLAERYPELNQITYNRGFGLNFMLPERSEWIYWGDGNDFTQKLENMAAIHHAIAKNQVSASIIDLRSPEKPYYR